MLSSEFNAGYPPQRRRQALLEKRDKKVFGSSLARAGQGFAALPASRRELKRPSCLTRKADPPKLTRSEGRTPYSKGGPPLPERRTPLTRKAGLPYSQGGYYLLARRVLLTREADVLFTREAELERRILFTRKADTPYSEGGYSLLGSYSQGGYSLLERRILVPAQAGAQAGPRAFFTS